MIEHKLRILRLLNILPSIRILLLAAQRSLATITGCFGLLMILIVSFAMIGHPLLGHVKYQEGISRNSNFDSPIHALLVMTRVAGGEDWVPSSLTICCVFAPSLNPQDLGRQGEMPRLNAKDLTPHRWR